MTEFTPKIGWDDQLDDIPQEEFVVLKPGQYHFKVTGFERSEWGPQTKLAGYRYAAIDLRFSNNEEESTGNDKLTLHPKHLWRVRAFFKAIGCDVEEGKPFVPNWANVLGAEGECIVRNREWTSTRDGKKYVSNEVERYLEPPEGDDGGSPLPF